jgi:fermentation-respiration switch protein FrsA (DUF1100 family)
MKRAKVAGPAIERLIVYTALALITLHMTVAALVDLNASTLERVGWAAAALAGGALAAFFYYSRRDSRWRGIVLVASGLPAALTGIGIHALHIASIGFMTSDITGAPMLVAGAVLTVIGVTILVRAIHTWWRRLLLVPVGLLVLFYLVFPATLSIYATNVAKRELCCDNTPAVHGFPYEDVTFETPEGLTLAAWYIPSQNSVAVITVHGAGGDRIKTMDEALVLARHGYGVLMMDVEGFGESEGRSNSFGWAGARDVHAAVDYLLSRDDIDDGRIGGLGLSMGAEVMIQAAGESEGLRAVVAEGGSSRTPEDFAEMPGTDTKLGMPFQWVLAGTLRVMSGQSIPPPLKEMAAQIGPRPVLLIAADLDEETTLNGLYQEVGGPSFELWIIPEADHIGALDNHPEEYEDRVISFFDGALLGDAD